MCLLADLKLQGFAYLSNFSSTGLAETLQTDWARRLQGAVKAKSAADLDKVRECPRPQSASILYRLENRIGRIVPRWAFFG